MNPSPPKLKTSGAHLPGAFFGLLAIVQLTRTVLGWPVQVAGVMVPGWAFRAAKSVA
ncbi:MAG: hypothetical protein ABJB33_07270 [Gemmatimonadota bacterium]